MREAYIMTALGAVLFAAGARAQTCPELLPGEGDWDGDGVRNGEDDCCFVASAPGAPDEAVCADTDTDLDRNGNSIPAGEEGSCCVYFEVEMCKRSDTCGDGASAVPCDELLYYWHMPLDTDGDGQAESQVTCTGEDCVCFTIGDFDGDDGHGEPADGGAAGPDDGPFETCPTVADEGGANEDGDLWGDACDLCPEVEEEAAVCDPAADHCTASGKCVPFAAHGEDGVVDVAYRCSFSPDMDGDGTGDACDGCAEDNGKTEPGVCGCGAEDKDKDEDGVADCKDVCPEDHHKAEPGVCGCGIGDQDADGDGVADCKDNCPDLANPDQADGDLDGKGDLCVEEDLSYTGAFACDCAAAPGRASGASFLVASGLSILSMSGLGH